MAGKCPTCNNVVTHLDIDILDAGSLFGHEWKAVTSSKHWAEMFNDP
jgi:hypothetical protein